MSIAAITPRPRTTFCWWCGGKLASSMTRKGKIYHSALMQDPVGNVHAVHKCCKRSIDQEKPVTAQQSEHSTEERRAGY